MRRATWMNAALVALALGTFGVVWATREAPSTGELLARKGKLLPFFRKDAVTRVTLTRDGHQLGLVSDSAPEHLGEFRIERPTQEPADVASVKQLLDTLDTASAVRGADDVAPQAAGLTEKSPRLRVEMGPKVALVTLGGPALTPEGAHFVEVTAEGSSKRYVVSASVNEDLNLPLNKLYEPRLLDYAPSEISRIELMDHTLERGQHGLFFEVTRTGRELVNPLRLHALFDALTRLVGDPRVALDEAAKELGGSPNLVKLTLADAKQPPVMIAFEGNNGRYIVRVEQQGHATRAGSVPTDVGANLRLAPASLALDGPLAARVDEVEELRLTRGDQKLVLSRKDKAFILKAPHSGDVALDAGNERIASIIALSGTRPTTTDPEQLGLAKPDGELTVQVTGENAIERHEQSVTLGRVRRDGSICAERQLDHVRLCFAPEAAKTLAPDPSLLKALALNDFAPSDLSWLETQTPGLKQRVERHDDGSYELEEPAGYNHDGALITDAVQALGTLQAVRWVAGSAEPSFGFGNPELRVRFEIKNPAGVHELVVGAATGGGHYARLEPDPAVFLLSDQAYEALSLPFLDRALCPDPKDQLSVTVKSASGEGVRTGDRLSFPSHPEGLTETLRSLKAEFAVHVGPAKPNEGLSKPQLEISYGPSWKVAVGSCDKLRGQDICYARRNDVNATFAVSAHAANVLLGATRHETP